MDTSPLLTTDNPNSNKFYHFLLWCCANKNNISFIVGVYIFIVVGSSFNHHNIFISILLICYGLSFVIGPVFHSINILNHKVLLLIYVNLLLILIYVSCYFFYSIRSELHLHKIQGILTVNLISCLVYYIIRCFVVSIIFNTSSHHNRLDQQNIEPELEPELEPESLQWDLISTFSDSSLDETASPNPNPTVCTICIEDLNINNDSLDFKIVKTRCNHCYHLKCIKKWLNDNNHPPKCPICRQLINYKQTVIDLN